MAAPGDRLTDRPRLVALTVFAAVLETALVWRLGPRSAVALAPQAGAPAPFDVFHDLRWLFVYHASWVGFVFELLGALVVRTAFTAIIVREAWPIGTARPPLRTQLRRGAVYTGVLALVVTPWVALLFAAAVTSLSWLVIVSVPVLVMLGLVMHHGVVTGRWWRDPPAPVGLVAIAATFVVLTVGGGVLAYGSPWLRLPVASAVGVANAWSWLLIVGANCAPARVSRRGRPYSVVWVAAVLALVLVGSAAGFAVAARLERERAPLPRVTRDAPGPPLLVVKGFNSEWDGRLRRWVGGEHRIERFSYRGVTTRGRPLAYERADTHRSLRALARSMRRQVAALHRSTGEPVSIVAESEGALVALTYLAGTPRAPVRTIVALSPLLAPGRVYYPPGGSEGWGVAAGATLGLVAGAVNGLGPVDVSADTPLFRSMVDHAPAMRALLRCPVPGVRELAILPVDSGLAAPGPSDLGVRYAVVPAFHGGLLGNDDAARLVRRTLEGRPVRPSATGWRTVERLVQAIATPWHVPELRPELNPAWAGRRPSSCAAVRRELQAWLGAGR